MNKACKTLLRTLHVISLIALVVINSHAACVQGSYYVGSYTTPFSGCGVYLSSLCQNVTSPATIQDNNYYYSDCSAGRLYYCNNLDFNWNCHTSSGRDIQISVSGCGGNICSPNVPTNSFCTTRCDTQQEADSVNCIMDGNIWQDGTCKVNHCKAADSTWLSTSIAACTGSNNYALVNTDSTCEHVGTCCPNDSIPSGNTCKWRCDSVLTQCNGRSGALFGAVLPDTAVSGQDTTFSYQCFYNCAYSPNPDSSVYLVEGNVVLSGPSDSISDGIKSEWFSSVRSTTGSIYVYDYLSPAASEYVDSIAAMKCVEHLWRCVINNKYVYWYDNQEVPAGCTNIVRVK